MQDEQSTPEEITLDDLDKSASVVKPTSSDVQVRPEDMNSAFSRVTEENADLKQEIDELRKKVRTTEILDELMKPSAAKAFTYMFVYSGVVGVILLMNGFGCFKNPLEPEVLKFLVGSTAATVIGLVGMVLTGIFVGARK
ncbi:MAG: hypothetical protein N838_28025 [Thiohalocapsa sp. PB-PSB1]|nr:MAG: hypothetical protein N838_28025 [Thiohalocapsa sp. PB-PSB1]MBL4540608.1 hypothetical protein [Paracoccaceae bacterium]